MTNSPRGAFVLGLTIGLFVALGPACSNNGGAGGGTGGTGGAGGGTGVGGGSAAGGGTGMFCNDFANAYCDFGVRCGFISAAALAECAAYASPLYCAGIQSVAKGYITLDSTKTAGCVNALKTASCDSLAFFSDECASLSTPNSTTGQGCFSNGDCKNANEGCGGNNCMQTCGATGAQGQPCPRTGSCATGLRCDSVTGTCLAPGGVGAACTYSGDCNAALAYCDDVSEKCAALPTAGQACRTSSPQCSGDSYCNFAGGNMCTAKLALNATCVSTSTCLDTLFCDLTKNPDSCQTRLGTGVSCSATGSNSCQANLRCIATTCQAPKAAGVTCASDNECADNLGCDSVLRSCQARVSDLKEGQTCTNDQRNCTSDLLCRGAVVNPAGGMGTVGMCVVPKVGDACSSKFGAECPDHAFCNLAVDGGPGTCVAGSLGSPCTSATQCLADHYCEAGLCAERKVSGSACTSSSSCKSPFSCMTHPITGAKTCGTLPDVGQACSDGGTTSTSCLFPNVCSANGTCVHAGKVGEPCLSSNQCLNGKCDRDAGVCQTTAAVGADCRYASDCTSLRCFKGKCEASCP